MGDLQRGQFADSDDRHHLTVLEVELEESVLVITAIEIASIIGEVVEFVIHLWDGEMLHELTLTGIFPKLTQTDR